MVIGRSPEETYWEFFRADRTRDAKAWAAVMRYPHVRVAAPGRIEYFRTEEEFVAVTDWAERTATGWVRTEGIEPQVFQSTRDKVHVAGGWVRYSAENKPILSNRVVYALTRGTSVWGVQARFACGASTTWQEAPDEEPANKVKRFLELLIDGELNTCAAMVRFPFIFVGTGSVQGFRNESSLISSLPSLSSTLGEMAEIRTIQNGLQGANIAVSFLSDAVHTKRAVFLVERGEETHRIASLSTID